MSNVKNNTALEKAYMFAAKAHKGQFRKYTNEPYITHPQAVSRIVQKVSRDEDMAVAAMLHDVVEDTAVTLEDLIKEGFSPRAVRLIDRVTNPSINYKTMNRQDRKAMDLLHLSRACPEGKTIKLADIIHNMPSIIKHDPDFAVVYMREKRYLVEVLDSGSAVLYCYAKKIIDNYYLSIESGMK